MARRTHLFAVVRHPREPKILLTRSDREWRLPRAVVPGAVWGADARAVAPALAGRLGTPVWLLRQLHSAEKEAIFELELLDADWEGPAHGRWLGAAGLDGLRLKDEAQRPLLAGYLEALERGDVPEQRPPWALPGWGADARSWVELEVRRLGHSVAGVEQVKHWSISSVLRVSTDGPDFYFKVPARLPYFVDEAMVTARLVERFPDYVPAPLAVDLERGWLLLPEFDEVFGWDAPLELRRQALRRFAGLQRRTADLAADLLADGCHDRRLNVLETQVDQLVHDPEAVARLTDEEVIELRRLAPELKALCGRLAALGLPSTLVHGDLHMMNVARVGGELVYFDWTDACVAHPFVDLLSLEWETDEADRAALLDAYLEPWQGAVTADALREAVALAAVVIPLHHAVSYQRIVANLEPSSKPELDATHGFLRQVLAHAGPMLSSGE